MKAYELLSDPSKWTQGRNARDSQGRPSGVSDPEACSFCLYGAIVNCYTNNGMYTEEYEKALYKLQDKIPFPAQWNDNPKRTHEEVVALLKELDI